MQGCVLAAVTNICFWRHNQNGNRAHNSVIVQSEQHNQRPTTETPDLYIPCISCHKPENIPSLRSMKTNHWLRVVHAWWWPMQRYICNDKSHLSKFQLNTSDFYLLRKQQKLSQYFILSIESTFSKVKMSTNRYLLFFPDIRMPFREWEV